MPKLTCWYIRAALIYLTLGFTYGALILFHKGLPFAPGHMEPARRPHRLHALRLDAAAHPGYGLLDPAALRQSSSARQREAGLGSPLLDQRRHPRPNPDPISTQFPVADPNRAQPASRRRGQLLGARLATRERVQR